MSLSHERMATMLPHISQFQSGQFVGKARDTKLDGNSPLQMSKKSSEHLMPMPLAPRQQTSSKFQINSNLSQLATKENSNLDIDSIRHIREWSRDTTPTSAVESIFELPSGSLDSPASSTHSSFIAELEDTSIFVAQSKNPFYPAHPHPKPKPKKRAIPPPAIMEFKSSEMTARAVIKVVDETIANIEAANKELLCRVEAAEEAARVLREQNSNLQQKLDDYNRPKTAPSQSSPRPARHKISPSLATPLSTFNTMIDQLTLDNQPTKPPKPPLYPLHTRKISTTSSKSLLRPSNIDLTNDPFISPKSIIPIQRRSPPLPLLPAHEISAPIPGSVMRHEVTYAGRSISSVERRARNISLEEARRREKPLPPLGPMSPSILRGVVEIGTPKGVDEFGRPVRMSVEIREEGEKKRRGFSDFFRRKGKAKTF